jgi:type I restriction enzyme M protein
MPSANETELQIQTKNGKIFSPIRQKWLEETPEERVRQEYLLVLVNEYGFRLDQIAEEMEVTGRGSGHARADFVIWRSAQDKTDGKNPLVVVECKSDNITIQPADYGQGDNYARLAGARFFVTHNHHETKFWRVLHDRMPKWLEEIENIPHADASDKEIEDLIKKLKVFKETEFADLLHECHNVIRNREKLDPAAAFDEIAKILFVKVYVERELKTKRRRVNIFTADYLDEQIGDDPLNDLFGKTKQHFKGDQIFTADTRINLKASTGREIVAKLERYDLSETSEDIKGIAFERFLGRTFRGEIGQFFTPRTIVEFMVHMLDPQEGDVVCDPASGSGGFLIRFFEVVRQQILADADRQYQAFKVEIATKKLPEDEQADLRRRKYAELQKTIDPIEKGSRLWQLANKCIYGTDANDRMARTSKMNMIMHGDGHGGVHHHDGFINVNGLFEDRFDIVLTNPPFGANVESGDVILESEVTVPDEIHERYVREHGPIYMEAQRRVHAAKGKPIASLFDLPKNAQNKIKTEILFIERCLRLLKQGGRMGIVLPEGVFNNPSLAYVREFCEDRAYIRAVVSLPQETFYSSGTSVKASLLFLQRFTVEEQNRFNEVKAQAQAECRGAHQVELDALENDIRQPQYNPADFYPASGKPTDAERAAAYDAARAANVERIVHRDAAQKRLKELMETIRQEARALLKERFDYPVFMYEAEKVGITATGEADRNELFPNESSQGDDTALDLYRRFQRSSLALSDISARRLSLPGFVKAFRVQFRDLSRWDPGSFCSIDWHWPRSVMRPIGSLITTRKEKVDRNQTSFAELQPITIHFDGTVDKRKVETGQEYTMEMFRARPGDMVVAKIDLKNGAVGIVPAEWQNVVVTNHFAVYQIDTDKVLPDYLHRLIQQRDFKEYLWRHKVGAEGRKEVTLDFFESIEVPVPDLSVQRTILLRKQRLMDELERVQRMLSRVDVEVEQMILGAMSVETVGSIES